MRVRVSGTDSSETSYTGIILKFFYRLLCQVIPVDIEEIKPSPGSFSKTMVAYSSIEHAHLAYDTVQSLPFLCFAHLVGINFSTSKSFLD